MKKEIEDTDSTTSRWQFYQNKGNNLFRKERNYIEAIKALCEAVCHGDKEQQIESFYTRARVYFELHDYENVIADCTAAINSLCNDNDVKNISKIYNTRGIAYKYKGMISNADADFKFTAKLLINSAINR